MIIEKRFNPSCSETTVSIAIPDKEIEEFRKKLEENLSEKYKDEAVKACLDLFDDAIKDNMEDGYGRVYAGASNGDYFVAIKTIADELGIEYEEEMG